MSSSWDLGHNSNIVGSVVGSYVGYKPVEPSSNSIDNVINNSYLPGPYLPSSNTVQGHSIMQQQQNHITSIHHPTVQHYSTHHQSIQSQHGQSHYQQPVTNSVLPPVVIPPHLHSSHHYPTPLGPTMIDPVLHQQHSQHIVQHPTSTDPYGANVPHHHIDHTIKLPNTTGTVQNITGNIRPVPHTPQGIPVPHPFSNVALDKGPELPQYLVDQGWTKCWSKREGRYYFFNCNTNESIWELPVPGRIHHHGHHYDPMTDPLGIQHSNVHSGMKRRASSGDNLGTPPVKRIIVSGPWDLEICSNVFTTDPQTPRHVLVPPHPQIEQLRYQLLVKLRQCYQQACKSREQIDAPKESLNRWLIEQKIGDCNIDPLFPSCGNSEGVVSQIIFQEIMNDVPMKVVKPRFTGDARKQLAKFAEACKKAIETRSASSDDRKLVKWKVEETFSWLRDTVGAPYDAFQERMAHLKETIQPLVHEAAKSSVEGICRKISVLSKQYAQQVREAHMNLFVEPQNVRKDYPMENGRYRSSAALCGEYQYKEEALPQPNKPLVDYLQQDKDNILIKHKNEPVRISTAYLQKLDALYKYHVVDDKKQELFLTRVYCLLKRYNGFCNEFNSCQSTQGSIPTPVFEAIQRNFGVTFECFSSPFNCYFRNYCSIFPDIDGYFGSSGSFFDFHPVSGSFQLNPPLCHDLIDAAITHVENLITATQEPISFIIFVPEFDVKEKEIPEDQDSVWIRRLQNSAWKRKQVTIPAFEHEYRSGSQHIVPKSEIPIRSHHATVVFWLQNDTGNDEWKPTEEKVDAVVDAYRPGRERERDRQDLLAPERQNPTQADKALAAAKAIANSEVTNTSHQTPSITPNST